MGVLVLGEGGGFIVLRFVRIGGCKDVINEGCEVYGEGFCEEVVS